MLATLFALLAQAAGAAAGDTTADRVLGQPGFATAAPGFGGAAGLRGPLAVAVDPSSGRLYVADTQNNRVLSWPSAATFANGEAADRVIGQADFTGDGPNRGTPGNATASSLWVPSGLAVDGSGTLYVADNGNNRVLAFTAPTSTGMAASMVWGQADFAGRLPNASGLDAQSFDGPLNVAVDASGNLYVVDLNNNRVLEFAPGAHAAGRVFGQPGFASALCNAGGRSASTLCVPWAVAVDAAGTVYVADGANNRVLAYEDPAVTDTVADRVYGQVDFTGQVDHVTANAANLDNPKGLAIDGAQRLYVADNGANRILVYDDAPDGDAIADVVLGQGGSFTSRVANQGGLGADGLFNVYGLAVDASGNLYAADMGNHRVLGFDQPAPVSGPGGGSFSGPSATGTGTITATFVGGGPACTFSVPQFIGAPPGMAPVPPTLPAPGVAFPQGMFVFDTLGCTPGATLAFTIVYPQPLPPGTAYYKYGPTAGDTLPHWYVLPSTVSGNTASFEITDGGLGDDDLTANGAIADQGGPGQPAAAPPGAASATPVPALSQAMLAALAMLVAVGGGLGRSLRRQCATRRASARAAMRRGEPASSRASRTSAARR